MARMKREMAGMDVEVEFWFKWEGILQSGSSSE